MAAYSNSHHYKLMDCSVSWDGSISWLRTMFQPSGVMREFMPRCSTFSLWNVRCANVILIFTWSRWQLYMLSLNILWVPCSNTLFLMCVQQFSSILLLPFMSNSVMWGNILLAKIVLHISESITQSWNTILLIQWLLGYITLVAMVFHPSLLIIEFPHKFIVCILGKNASLKMWSTLLQSKLHLHKCRVCRVCAEGVMIALRIIPHPLHDMQELPPNDRSTNCVNLMSENIISSFFSVRSDWLMNSRLSFDLYCFLGPSISVLFLSYLRH